MPPFIQRYVFLHGIGPPDSGVIYVPPEWAQAETPWANGALMYRLISRYYLRIGLHSNHKRAAACLWRMLILTSLVYRLGGASLISARGESGRLSIARSPMESTPTRSPFSTTGNRQIAFSLIFCTAWDASSPGDGSLTHGLRSLQLQ